MSASIVIDSSYALACVMPDEARPVGMEAVLAQPLLAPFIWPIEVASAARHGVARRRFDAGQARLLCANVANLDVEIAGPWHNEPQRYLELALTHELTPYDAIYLDLALSRHNALATCDAALAAVARRLGVPVHA